MARQQYRIGMDIGGTFTDFILWHQPGGKVFLHKRLTTPHDPAEGALAGLHELLSQRDLGLDQVDEIVHGTTLVTNAILERRGARTALLTTRGFRDILEMGYEQRYDIYDLFLQYPEPLVPRRWRIEIDERMTRDGEVLQPLDLEQVRAAVAALIDQGVEALAICFLHAYRNPSHERAAASFIRREFPGLAVSVSSEVVPEIREYERTATTVANAYVQPLMDHYIGRLEADLKAAGFRGHFFLMQSSGGSASATTSRSFPIRLLESGPAAGALVASFIGRTVELPNVLSFDMGGTTAKACLVQDGQPNVAPMMEAGRVHRFKRGSGIPIKAPVVDMIEIGAGGGSIAFKNTLGLLKVGPASAGADPGPACYGQGGREPTVTDACLVLGYFDPDFFLGGEMRLDLDAAREVITQLGRELGLTEAETAWGIYQIVCENMAGAARVHIIEKGHDPRRYPIVAFGGAGPAHAVRVAYRLGAPEVIVPAFSGVASAIGLLLAPVRFDFARSYPGELSKLDWPVVDQLYREMETQARQVLQHAGVDAEAIKLERRADMRLSGQFHEITVPVPGGALARVAAEDLSAAFDKEYERLYHSVLPSYEPMVLNWWLRASGAEPAFTMDGAGNRQSAADTADQARKGERVAYFPELGGFVNIPVYSRYRLAPGMQIAGPAIIEERESTTVFGPNDLALMDSQGHLRIKIGGKA